jgi:DUF1009 family protein
MERPIEKVPPPEGDADKPPKKAAHPTPLPKPTKPYLNAVSAEGIERIGVVAGQGQFPLLLAEAARSQGVHVVGFGLVGFASREFENAVDEMEWVELGQFNRLFELLAEHKIAHLAMVGRVPHNSIWQYRHFDVRAVKLIASSINRKADALLSRICDEFRREGIDVIDSTLFLKSLMPQEGLLTDCRKLTRTEEEDIEFGMPMARRIAGMDIGQSIIVKDKAVVAVEGLEGTDECLKRGAALAGEGVILVKVSKPRQDARFDVPVIGIRTIELMRELKGAAIAISAGETLVFNREEAIRLANEAGVVVIAISNPELSDTKF